MHTCAAAIFVQDCVGSTGMRRRACVSSGRTSWSTSLLLTSVKVCWSIVDAKMSALRLIKTSINLSCFPMSTERGGRAYDTHIILEPCVQGHNGSGSVFFSMCNLRCSFCQNHDIAHQKNGFNLQPDELADWFLKLQAVGNVHNINLITPEHVVPQVALAIMHARDQGLTLPIIYNTSAYDSLASLELLDGLVDIYLPDFKLWEPATSKRLLKADDYAAAAKESIKAMHAQVGDLCFTGDGIAKKGLLVRHLVMPGLEAEGARIMRFLAEEVSTDCFVNIMGTWSPADIAPGTKYPLTSPTEQYHPDAHVGKTRRKTAANKEAAMGHPHGEQEGDVRYADINRAVSSEEVRSVRKAAEAAGLWRFCDPPGHDGFSI